MSVNNTPLTKADYLSLWTHFEGTAAEIRSQMLNLLTLAHGFIASLAGFTILESTDKNPRPMTLVAASIVGLLIAILAMIVAWDCIHHMQRNFYKATAIRGKRGTTTGICPALGSALDEIEAKLGAEKSFLGLKWQSVTEPVFKYVPIPEFLVFLVVLIYAIIISIAAP